MARPLQGLPFAASADLSWYTDGALSSAARRWLEFEVNLPGAQRDLIAFDGRNPDINHLQRSKAVWTVGQSLRAQAASDMAAVTSGSLTLDEWRDRLQRSATEWSLSAAQVGYGAPLGVDALTAGRLTGLRDNVGMRLTSLRDQVRDGSITEAQAAAWGGQAVAGSLTTAASMGAAQRLAGQAVRRIMSAGENHCATCPGKARTFPFGIEQCVSECGGWPGDGSDQCHGNCMCRIIAASAYSVFGDEATARLQALNLDYRGPTADELAGIHQKPAVSRAELARRHLEAAARWKETSRAYEQALAARRGVRPAMLARAEAIAAILRTVKALREAGIELSEVAKLAQSQEL